MGVDFNDENTQKLFGFEDAESEPIERLKNTISKRILLLESMKIFHSNTLFVATRLNF